MQGSGDVGEDNAEDALIAFGIDPAEAAELIQEEEAPAVPAFEENRQAIELFLLLKTQWRVGMAGPIGLDYAGLRAGAAMAGKRLTPALFEDLRQMEAGALDGFAELRAIREAESQRGRS